MLVKVTCQAEGLGLEKDERLTINCGVDSDTVITIEHSDVPGKLVCTTQASVTPSSRVGKDFDQEDPQAIPRVDQFLTDTVTGSMGQLGRAIRVFMWRRGLHVEYCPPPVFIAASWSLDGHIWNAVRTRLQLTSWTTIPIYQGPVPAEITEYVGPFVANGGDEPLARQILREAWAQKSASPESVTWEKLLRILKAVSDLLWILDFYQGHQWAIRYVRLEVLDAWKSESNGELSE